MTSTPPSPRDSPLSRGSVERIVLDLLADELARSRGRSALDLGAAGWSRDTRVDGDGLDLDSLERLDAVAALNEYFHLHEHGAEDHLLTMRRVGEWCDLVETSLAATGAHLTFRTSGSTGEPRRRTHAIADLLAEVDAWAAMFPDARRVVSLVPAHHIYGTVFAALLPDRLGVEAASGRFAAGAAVRGGGTGSLVVGTPTMWAYLARSTLSFSPGITGVSSTAPLSAQLAHRLAGQRLDRLVEIYGSSETGGVAHRTAPSVPWTLLPHWRHAGGDVLERGATGDGRVELPDAARWFDDRHFALDGRRDGAVQIGGYNIFPERVRRRLLEHAGVADAAVRVDAETGRLKAFVVRAAGADDDAAFADALDAWCGGGLTDAERPRRFACGRALPRNEMGKLTDW